MQWLPRYFAYAAVSVGEDFDGHVKYVRVRVRNFTIAHIDQRVVNGVFPRREDA